MPSSETYPATVCRWDSPERIEYYAVHHQSDLISLPSPPRLNIAVAEYQQQGKRQCWQRAVAQKLDKPIQRSRPRLQEVTHLIKSADIRFAVQHPNSLA